MTGRIGLLVTAGIGVAGILTLGSYRRPRLVASGTEQRLERLRTPAGMVHVPGGHCFLGTDDENADADARPRRRVFVASFYIDRMEVTNDQYRRFKQGHQFLPGEERLPVTNVTYEEAEASARWEGKRLPTEEEWEKAARGTDGRRFPWGNDWEPARVAARARRPRPLIKNGEPGLIPSRLQRVGSLPAGASPYGCLDMSGNAWEWVQGFYLNNPIQRIIRGGAVGYGERSCRTYMRGVEGAEAT